MLQLVSFNTKYLHTFRWHLEGADRDCKMTSRGILKVFFTFAKGVVLESVTIVVPGGRSNRNRSFIRSVQAHGTLVQREQKQFTVRKVAKTTITRLLHVNIAHVLHWIEYGAGLSRKPIRIMDVIKGDKLPESTISNDLGYFLSLLVSVHINAENILR